MSWDEALPEEFIRDFNLLINEVEQVESIKFPRAAIFERQAYEIHAFCYALSHVF